MQFLPPPKKPLQSLFLKNIQQRAFNNSNVLQLAKKYV